VSKQVAERSVKADPPPILETAGLSLLLLAFIGFLVTFLGNWYPGTTIQISDVSRAGIAGLSLIAAGFAGANVYRLTSVHPRWWSLWPEIRERRPVVWLARIAAKSLFIGFVAALAGYYYVLLATPYQSGRVFDVQGTVHGFTRSFTRARVCLLTVTLDLDSGQRERVCFERGRTSRIRLGPADLQPGDPVIVRHKESFLGTSVVAIVRAE